VDIDDYHQQRAGFLRPLSMTCRAMRLRLLPWVWEHTVCRRRSCPRGDFVCRLDVMMNTLHVDVPPAINVRYSCALVCPWLGADSCPLKVHDGTPRVDGACNLFIC
jgi:hypothetical protein